MVNETNKDIILENMIETEVELANPPTDGSSVSVLADPDPEDTVEAYISTYEIGRGWDMEDKLEYSIRDIEDAITLLQTDKADVNHTHDGYAIVGHNHDEDYSVIDHNHSDIYADASHTHTASSVGAIATDDVATVSEVGIYLGI
ncbi:MAG: hypothetical protein J6R59_09810 [Paludibacteraceae bacterium]|nr:hypothetical protein [Paludibacteraceae bacterium]